MKCGGEILPPPPAGPDADARPDPDRPLRRDPGRRPEGHDRAGGDQEGHEGRGHRLEPLRVRGLRRPEAQARQEGRGQGQAQARRQRHARRVGQGPPPGKLADRRGDAARAGRQGAHDDGQGQVSQASPARRQDGIDGTYKGTGGGAGWVMVIKDGVVTNFNGSITTFCTKASKQQNHTFAMVADDPDPRVAPRAPSPGRPPRATASTSSSSTASSRTAGQREDDGRVEAADQRRGPASRACPGSSSSTASRDVTTRCSAR